MRALLDTSVLLGGIPDGLDSAAISVASIAELDFGIRRARDDGQRRQRRAVMATTLGLLDPIPVDVAVAQQWGVLAAHTAAGGRQPRRRAMDLLIAATAQVHGLTLVTRDEDMLWLADVLDVRAA